MVNEESYRYFSRRLNIFADNPYKIWTLQFWGRLFRCIRWAYQRIKKGYCDQDMWDLGDYYIVLMHNSIKEFADNTNSYPMPLPSENPSFVHAIKIDSEEDLLLENWKNILYGIARDLELGCDGNTWDYNEMYWKDDDTFDKEAAFADLKKKEEHRNRALNGIKEYFDHLWD